MSSWRASPFRYPVDPFLSEPSGVFSLSFSPLSPLALSSLSLSISLSFFFPLFFFFSLMRISRSRVTALLARLRARADPAASFALFLRRSLRVIGRFSLFFFFYFFNWRRSRRRVDPRRVTGMDIDDLSLSLSLVILSHLFLVSKLVVAVPPDTVRLRRDQPGASCRKPRY